jgi:hypothetical protein
MILAAQQAQIAEQGLGQGKGIGSVQRGEPSAEALPLPEDRGAAALEQSLKRLQTTTSAMMIVAHPDDEDGALLYSSSECSMR